MNSKGATDVAVHDRGADASTEHGAAHALADADVGADERGRRADRRASVFAVGALGVGLVAAVIFATSVPAGPSAGALAELRAVRLLGAAVAGAALATAGVLVQGLFRNPLASPSILGTTAGASLGGELGMVLLTWAPGALSAVRPDIVVPVFGVTGAVGSLGLLLLLTRGRSGILSLLLTGFILSSLLLSLGSFLISLAQDSWALGRAVVAWSLGSLSAVGMRHIVFAAPLLVAGFIAAFSFRRPLDVLLSGELEAQSLGVDVKRVRRWIVVWVGVLSGAAVSLGGGVAFVGLVVPHAARGWVGPVHARLLPVAAAGGATFLVLCDLATHLRPGPGELPLGVVTGLIGAPTFLYLLYRTHREVNLG